VEKPTDESLGEMEVAGRPYCQGGCVLAVHMDRQNALPPLYLALLQVLSSAVVFGTVVLFVITTVPLQSILQSIQNTVVQ
jgi:hypothetical protein